MKKALSALSAFLLLLSLSCAPLTALAAAAQTDSAYVTEYHRDLLVEIPADMTYTWYEGRWASLEIYMDLQSSGSFLNIAARQMDTQEPPILTDGQGLPILDTDAVRELLNGTENLSVSVLGSGETQLAGIPAVYIETLFYGDTKGENPDWKAKVTRAIYEGFAYDILFAAPADEYEDYLSTADSITGLLRFDARENETQSVALGDIMLAHPVRNVIAGSTDTSFQITVSIEGIQSLFRVEYDNTRIHEEGFLDNPHWLNLHLQKMTQKSIPDNLMNTDRNVWESTELFREEITVNGKRALRAAYHIYDYQFYSDEYAEVIVFTHNGGLYSLFLKDNVGEETRLHAFADPMIESIRFDESAPAPTIPPTTDTVRWINYADAILTLSNSGDIERFGGREPTLDAQNMIRNALEESWGITNRESLEATLTRLRETGQRAAFANIVAKAPPQLYGQDEESFRAAIENEAEVLQEVKSVLELRILSLQELAEGGTVSSTIEQKIVRELLEREIAELIQLEITLDLMDSADFNGYLENINRTYAQSGENALLAWDYIRAMNLISEGYVVGFYAFEEALALSLEFAIDLQEAFSSWDALYGDYLAGFAFWHYGDENDPTTENYRRAELIRGLKFLSYGPYSFSYDTPLTAEWPEPPGSATVESEYMNLIQEIIAPIDRHGRPDHAVFSAGEEVEFLLTADMFAWINKDALLMDSAMSYGWDAMTNFEDSPVTPYILINSGVAVAFESDLPQSIRKVDITETAYPQPGFSDLRTACVKVAFADDFSEVHGKEFEATIYLTLNGKRVPLSEISVSGMLFDENIERELLLQMSANTITRTMIYVFIISFIAILFPIVFLLRRRRKRLAYWRAQWEDSATPEEPGESGNSDTEEKHRDDGISVVDIDEMNREREKERENEKE